MAILEVTSENFETEVLNSTKPVLVDFYANWCGPCKMLRPILEELETEKQGIKFVSINVDDADLLAEKYGVQSIPCVVLFNHGKESARSVGFRPKEDFEEMLGEN